MELCSTKFFNHEEKSKDNHLRLCVANDDNELQLKHSRLSGRAGARSDNPNLAATDGTRWR